MASKRDAEGLGSSPKARDRMRKARWDLINRMGQGSLRAALDCLLDTPAVISYEERDMVLAERVPEDKVRFLIDILVRKGELACERFLDVLEEVDPALFEDIFGPVYSPTRPTQEAADKHFIDKNVSQLIEGVSNVDPILDHLLEKHVISQENYHEIRFQRDNQAKMRTLLELSRRSARAKDILCEVLMSIEPFLMNELNYQDFKHKVSMKEQSFPMEQVEQGHRRATDSEAAASTSSAHLSDASEMGCEYCAEVPDTRHWILVEPEVSTEKNVSTYSLRSDAGSYECSLSGLRWLCPGPINLQYHFIDWSIFSEKLAQTQYSPAGIPMELELMSGQLMEIHLPHFLCLGCNQSALKDAVKVLHMQDSGVSLETCELTRHHARIFQPSFSGYVVVWLRQLWRAVKNFFCPKAHCEVLLFRTCTAPLELHVYLVPKDLAHIQAIKQKEKGEEETPKGVWIDKPGTVGPLQLDSNICVNTSCDSEIQPNRMNLWPPSTSNYCEVYIEHPDGDFDMEVISPAENGEPIWKAKIRTKDYQRASGSRGSSSESASGYMVGDQHFIDKHCKKLIQRVAAVDAILDHLKKEKVITQEIYSEIRSKTTSQEKMRVLMEQGNIHSSPRGKAILYEALLEEETFLMDELQALTDG